MPKLNYDHHHPKERSVADEVREAVALFNAWDYFAAHEGFERAWHRLQGDEKLLCQALVQAGVCVYHWSNANFSGARSLALNAREKLEGLPGVLLGLDVSNFRTAFSAFTGPLLSSAAKVPIDPRTGPKLLFANDATS